MDNYLAKVYRQQLEQKANKELGYNNPLNDQKRVYAIRVAINEKVQEFTQRQQSDFNNSVKRIKDQL